MAQRVKSITAEIGIDSKKFTSGANAVKNKTNDIKGDLQKFAGAAAGVTAGIIAVAAAMKQMYDTAKEGIAIENAEARLAAFAGGAEGAKEVVNAMQDALGGAITKFDAATQASKLFELGLARNAEEAADLSKYIMSTGGNINDFSLMIANESKMRLDLYGMSIADVTARQKELSAANQSLTSQETFSIAVKEQLAAKTEKLEAAGYQALTSYDKLEAQLGDLTDGYKKSVNEGIEPFVSSLADSVEAINKVQMQHDVLKDALDAGIISEEEYRRTVNMKNRAEEMYQLTVKDLSKELDRRAVSEQRVKDLMVDYTDAQTWAMKTQIDNNEDVKVSEVELTDEMLAQLEERNEALTKFNENRIDQVATFSNLERSYAEDSTEIAEDLASVQAELALKRSQGYAEWGGTITGLLEKEDELKAKATEVEEAHQLATNSIILGYIEQKMAADGILTDEETEWLLAKGVEWGIYAENAVAAYQEAAAAADEAYKHFYDKTVTLKVQYTTSGNAGLGANEAPSGYSDYYPNPQADGGSYLVTGPTTFTAGEAGAEYATFTPVGQANQEQQQPAEFDYERNAQALLEVLLQSGAI